MSQPQPNLERQSIRPSLADLSDVDFFEKLETEANQLRNSRNSVQQNLNALPSIQAFSQNNAESVKVPAKKSRFAQQRQAELHTPQSEDDVRPVPTGRFELNLDSEKTGGSDVPQSKESTKIPLMMDITERYEGTFEAPNNLFDPKFSSDSFLGANPLKSVPSNNSQNATDPPAQTSIPPWELRRLADRQKSRASSSGPAELPVPQQPSTSVASNSSSIVTSFSSAEKQRISSENDSLLARMSDEEILQEQAALRAHLMQSNPELLTKLLTKFNVQAPANVGPCDSPSLEAQISKKQKNVRYAEEEAVIPCEASPRQIEKSPCVTNEDINNNFVTNNNSLEPCPLMFDWNGVRVADRGDDVHAAADEPSDGGIHTHQTTAFTLKQLLRLILSSVPAQRMMGLKILNQIVVRYFENSTHEINDAEMTLLANEFRDVMLDMLIVACRATRERNLGIATSALILLDSVFTKARIAQTSSSKHKCIVQPDWIEHLLTQTTLLADFHSQFEHQDLPRPSMTSIVQILCGMVALGESSKVSEEIVKRPSFLELIIQVLVAVPWPLNSKHELPDLAAFELLLAISKSSRTSCRSILDRGLLTPLLRFIGLPYWNLMGEDSDEVTKKSMPVPNDRILGVLIDTIGFQFELMAVFAGYGLGTSLRTTLDPLLRSTTFGLVQILETSLSANSSTSSFVANQQFNLISSYLKLLQSWMHCADDPHFSDPPHSINWSQVTEWESGILDFLKLASIPSPRAPGISKVLARACALITFYLRVSFKKKLNLTSCLDALESLLPQLETVFQGAVRRLLQCVQNQELKPDISEPYLLINLAKFKTCLNRIYSQSKNRTILAPGNLEHDFSDEAFALGCRLAFEYEELSLLPWALSVFHPKSETKSSLEKLLLATLFIRNSDGLIVSEILAESFRQSQSRIEHECQIFKEQTPPIVAPQLSVLLPIFEDYINYSGTSTQISEPSPHQIKNQLRQDDKAAFLLTSTWPLLAITCLKPEHLTSSTGTSPQIIRNIDVARGSYALAVVLQSSLNDIQIQFQSLSSIFPRFLSDRYSVWKSVLGSILAINSQSYWSSSPGSSDNIWNSIFEDGVCSQLIIRLIKSSPRYPPRLPKPQNQVDFKQKSEILKAQESEEAELFTLFTDTLAIYDPSSSERNHTFMKILTPFLSMSRAREFRGILFNDHAHILKNMLHVCLEDVINVDHSSNDDVDLEKYFYPIESNAQILHKFTEFLVSVEDSTHLDSFLVKYLIHHVSSQCWNEGLEEQIRIDLFKIILAGRKGFQSSDRICQLVLSYDPSISMSAILSSHTTKTEQRVVGDEDLNLKRLKSGWLEKVFSSKGDQHQPCLTRLKDLGWIVSP